jgi:hypothetical protein
MRVIKHRPNSWFLMEDGPKLLFDVNCSYSAFGYSRVIELSESERSLYQERDVAYLDELADKVQYHGLTVFAVRHLGPEVEAAVTEAVKAWRASGGEQNE